MVTSVVIIKLFKSVNCRSKGKLVKEDVFWGHDICGISWLPGGKWEKKTRVDERRVVDGTYKQQQKISKAPRQRPRHYCCPRCFLVAAFTSTRIPSSRLVSTRNRPFSWLNARDLCDPRALGPIRNPSSTPLHD